MARADQRATLATGATCSHAARHSPASGHPTWRSCLASPCGCVALRTCWSEDQQLTCSARSPHLHMLMAPPAITTRYFEGMYLLLLDETTCFLRAHGQWPRSAVAGWADPATVSGVVGRVGLVGGKEASRDARSGRAGRAVHLPRCEDGLTATCLPGDWSVCIECGSLHKRHDYVVCSRNQPLTSGRVFTNASVLVKTLFRYLQPWPIPFPHLPTGHNCAAPVLHDTAIGRILNKAHDIPILPVYWAPIHDIRELTR